MLSAFRPSRRFFARPLQTAALLFATAAAHAGTVYPETPDAAPNLGLLRSDGAGGTRAGHVYAFAPHPNGGVIVGGEFLQTADGTVRTHLLRLRADGTLDPNFDVELSSQGAMSVNAIASDAQAIYIGGRWQRVNGVERPAIAKLDLDGNLVTTWHEHTAANADNLLHGYDTINAIALGNGSVYVGGNIETLQLMGLAKLDATTGAIDQAWRAETQTHDHPDPPTMGWRASVHALLYTGTDLVVGGNFLQIGRVGRKGVARIALNAPIGGGHVAVGPYEVPTIGGSGAVTSLALDKQAGHLYVGGRYFAESGTYDNLMRTDAATGAIDPTWTPNPANEVAAIALGGGYVYYGGRFGTQVDDDPYLVRTRKRGNGGTDPNWLPLPDGKVSALLWQGGVQRLWIGGEFVDLGTHERNGLARISFSGEDLLFQDGLEDE